MFNKILSFCILVFIATNVAYAETVTLKSNTVVVVKNNNEISSKTYKNAWVFDSSVKYA